MEMQASVPALEAAEAAAPEQKAAGSPARGGRDRGWLVRRVLLGADVAGLTAAFLTAAELFPASGRHDSVGPWDERVIFLATLPFWAVLARAHGLYEGDEERTDHSTADELRGVVHIVTLGTFMVLLAGWLTARFHPTSPRLFTFWALAIVAVVGARALARSLVRRTRFYVQRTLIVGAGAVGQRIATKILQHPEYRIELVGFVDDQPKEPAPGLEGLTLLGRVAELQRVVREHGVDRVIVAFSNDRHDVTLGLVRVLGDLDVRIDVVPRLFEAMGPKVRMHTVE